jgi:hypothetical protein
MAATSEEEKMAYRMQGTYFENCSCEVACPCGASNLALPATYDRCRVLLAFNVATGEVDGVDISGKSVALFADTPKQMTDGGWRVGVFLDETASEEQREKLLSVFSGEQGGAPAMFAPLMGEMLGVEVAPIAFADDGRRHSVQIGDAVDIEVEDFAGAEEGSVMTLNGIGHPANSTLVLSRATRSKIAAFGLELDLTGKNGHSAPFSWQS